MTPDRPLVSIITPAYNSARFLGTTLASVAAQDYAPLEHIVVDGGSQDRTIPLLHGSTARWISEPDRGQSDALNKGLRLAQGEIIGWLNADDTYAAGAVSAAVAHFLAEPAAGLVFADCDWIDAAGRVLDRWQTRPTTLADLLLDGCTIPHQAAFLRREVFESAGGFDADLRYAMDYDLLLKGLRRFPASRAEGVWGSLRVWAGTKTHQHQAAFWPENVRVVERALAWQAVPPAVATEARRRVHLHAGLNAAWADDDQVAARELAIACGDGPPFGDWLALGEHVVAACQRPSYLAVSPAEAETLLGRVQRVPGLHPELAAHLRLVRAFRAWQRRDWAATRRHAGAALRGSARVRRNPGLWSVWMRAWLRPARTGRP